MSCGPPHLLMDAQVEKEARDKAAEVDLRHARRVNSLSIYGALAGNLELRYHAGSRTYQLTHLYDPDQPPSRAGASPS